MTGSTARASTEASRDGLHLVLLPALLCDGRLFRKQMPGLGARARVTVADLTLADTIADLASSVLARAPVERFALAGLSLGGYVALEIMRQAPERVLALALLDTSARADTPEATEARREIMALGVTDLPAVITRLIPKLLHPKSQEDPALVSLVRAMAQRVGNHGFQRQQRAILGRRDGRPHLGRIACRTLVLCGRDDLLTPVALHEELAAGIRGATLVVLDGCGHLATLDQPDRVGAALVEWLVAA